MKTINKYVAILMASCSLNMAFAADTCSYLEGQYTRLDVDYGSVKSHLGTTHYSRYKPCDRKAYTRVGLSFREGGIRTHFFIIVEPVTLQDTTFVVPGYYSLTNVPVTVKHSEYDPTTGELLWAREVRTTADLGVKTNLDGTLLTYGYVELIVPAGEGRKSRAIDVGFGNFS